MRWQLEVSVAKLTSEGKCDRWGMFLPCVIREHVSHSAVTAPHGSLDRTSETLLTFNLKVIALFPELESFSLYENMKRMHLQTTGLACNI